MLQYGFGLYSDKKWGDKEFKALSDTDKNFYHNWLPHLLVISHVGIVTKDTIPVIAGRLEYFHSSILDDLKEKVLKKNDLQDYLKKFIGFRANVYTKSTSEFLKDYRRSLEDRFGNFTSKKSQVQYRTKDILAQRKELLHE